MNLDDARHCLATFEDTLEAVSKQEETVLWLDHRLSDQLILIRLLDWFSGRRFAPARLSLICIGSYPGIDPFIGLGQLKAEQLASLADTRRPITEDQFRLGRTAWRAFTSSDPSEIEPLN